MDQVWVRLVFNLPKLGMGKSLPYSPNSPTMQVKPIPFKARWVAIL